MAQRPRWIELQIDELVLTGIRPGDRDRLAAAMQAELTRLLTAHGVPAGWQGGAQPVREIALAPDTPPREAGRTIARAVYGSAGG